MQKKFFKIAALCIALSFSGIARGASFQPVLKKALNGDAQAQFELGEMYDLGKGGLYQDREEAFRWYSKAAEKGLPAAQYNLGFMYYNGKGTEKNLDEAKKWWRLAARQGNIKAQNNLRTLGEKW